MVCVCVCVWSERGVIVCIGVAIDSILQSKNNKG